MRHLAIALLVALLAVSMASAATSTNTRAPLRFGGMVELGGRPVIGSAPGGGQLLRFVPGAPIELGTLLRNTSGGRLVLRNVRVLEPPRSLIRQIGTTFHRWNPPKCPPGALCPAHGFAMHPRAHRPRPFALRQGEEVGVELDLVLGGCAQILGANPAPLTEVRVTFQRPDGTTTRRVFSLGDSSLRLRMPKPGDCAQPRSSLSVDGPQKYESGSDWTVPGAKGDVCTIRGPRLSFRSRAYQRQIFRRLRSRRSERIELRLAHFAGVGTYRRAVVDVVLGAGKEVYRSRAAVVRVTSATHREIVATVAAGRSPSSTTRGIPFRVSGTLRCRVRG